MLRLALVTTMTPIWRKAVHGREMDLELQGTPQHQQRLVVTHLIGRIITERGYC